MSTIFSILLLVGLLAVKKSTADENECDSADTECSMCIISTLVQSVDRLTKYIAKMEDILDKKCDCKERPVLEECANLKNGSRYYLKSANGKFGIVDKSKQLGFMKPISQTSASKFTAVKISCNVFGLCVDGYCMSRCFKCKTHTNDEQSVTFHLNNSNEVFSQWKLISTGNKGQYNLKVDDKYGYLTYIKAPSGHYQLTLSTELSNETDFEFIEVK